MRRLLFIVMIAFAALLAITAAAHADAFTTITCQAPAIKRVDPIKNYSATNPDFPSAHKHSATVQNFSASLTGPQIRDRAASTCDVPSDNNIAWWPSPIAPDGSVVSSFTQYRLINDGDPDHAPVVAPPDDFSFISGDATNSQASAATQIWSCVGSPTEFNQIPASCPAGTTLIKAAFYNGQGCWDSTKGTGPGLGKTDGPADAMSHMVNDLDCDAPNTKIFRVSTVLFFDVALAGGHLSCDDHNDDGIFEGDPGSCLHVDFVFENGRDANGRFFNEAVMTECLNYNLTAPGTTSCFVDANGVFRRMGDATKTPILVGRATPPPPPDPVPASAMPLYGFDYTPGPVHLYKSVNNTPPSSSYVPVPDPARGELPPCESGEKPLVRLGKAGRLTETDDTTELGTLHTAGWTGDSTILCTVPAGTPASVPLYRVDMPDGDHLLTSSATEADQLVMAGGTAKQLGNVYPPEVSP